jgi:hypothetical protein
VVTAHQFLEALHHVITGHGIEAAVDQADGAAGLRQRRDPALAMLDAIAHVVDQPVQVAPTAVAIEQLEKNIDLGIAGLFVAEDSVEGTAQALARQQRD